MNRKIYLDSRGRTIAVPKNQTRVVQPADMELATIQAELEKWLNSQLLEIAQLYGRQPVVRARKEKEVRRGAALLSELIHRLNRQAKTGTVEQGAFL